MPFYRKQRNFIPIHTAAEKKSIKNGLHHAIYTSRFDKYVGDWKNDKKEGKGRFLTCSGKLYEGDWYRGFRHGFGTLSRRLENGTFSLEYRGEWIRGAAEGTGWRYYDNGDVYFGFWRLGKRHGFGKMWHTNGTFYVGYFNMGEREGIGMLIQANGNRYEGHWEANTKHGRGRFYHMHTGQLQEGCWLRDVCVMSKISDIGIRQCCDLPTEYPIPPECLVDSKEILENSEFWLKQKIGNLNKNLEFCTDQMY